MSKNAIDLTAPLLTRTGEPMTDPEGEKVTIKNAIFMSIDAMMEGDDKMEAAQKLRLARLGRKLMTAEDSVELTAKETTLALERAAKAMSVLVYGQLVEALDPGQLED